jgi:hypothetical protein
MCVCGLSACVHARVCVRGCGVCVAVRAVACAWHARVVFVACVRGACACWAGVLGAHSCVRLCVRVRACVWWCVLGKRVACVACVLGVRACRACEACMGCVRACACMRVRVCVEFVCAWSSLVHFCLAPHTARLGCSV